MRQEQNELQWGNLPFLLLSPSLSQLYSARLVLSAYLLGLLDFFSERCSNQAGTPFLERTEDRTPEEDPDHLPQL